MCALITDNFCSTIMSCNSPTNANDEIDLITFNNELSSLVSSIPKYNILIIGGRHECLNR